MRLLTGLALIACMTACSGAPTAGAADRAAAVAAMLTGKFDNVGQAGTDVDQRTVQLTVVPVLDGRDDGHWLYVEQAMTLTPDKPYGQRVYRVHEGADGEVLAELFSIEKPHRFVNGWQGGKLAQLQHDALRPLAGCTLHLRAEGDAWRGTTEGKGCESKRGGAAYATTEVTIDAKGLRAWERGFDASGKEVWGAKGPYEFIKRAEKP